MSVEQEKQLAAEAAAELVEDGMTVGLGTGSTVAYLLPALAQRSPGIMCAATSPRTEHAARELGLRIEPVASIDRFDLTIDGADQIAPGGWLVKGGGAAHTREKIVAGAAGRFIVIADSTKPVPALHSPVPLELLSFGLRATIRRIGPVSLRDVPPSPDGGVIADYHGPSAIRRRWRPGCPPCPAWSSTACSPRRWWRPSWWPGAGRLTGSTSRAACPDRRSRPVLPPFPERPGVR